MTDELLSVQGLRKSFGRLEVLKGVDLSLRRGHKLAIIGASGSGKSTCLRCINYLEQPSAGTITLDGELIGQKLVDGRLVLATEKELAAQRAQMGMVFQLFYLWPHLTVLENVAIAPMRVRGLAPEQARDLAAAMLEKVHMSHKSTEYPERLSGGQQQRVAIARALAQEPKLLLFDEPTSALDPELIGEVLKVIHELADEGRSMALVTHEIGFAREVADHVVFIDGGRVLEEGPPAQVLLEPQKERTRAFLNQLRAS
jgi:polar amino acid transport system ATP-binding protein